MRNIAALAENLPSQPPLTSEERRLFQAGLESLREYRLQSRANRVLPSCRNDEEEAA